MNLRIHVQMKMEYEEEHTVDGGWWTDDSSREELTLAEAVAEVKAFVFGQCGYTDLARGFLEEYGIIYNMPSEPEFVYEVTLEDLDTGEMITL